MKMIKLKLNKIQKIILPNNNLLLRVRIITLLDYNYSSLKKKFFFIYERGGIGRRARFRF